MDKPQSFDLRILSGTYAICRLSAAAPIPDWATSSAFSSVTRTPDELSVVCAEGAVPGDVVQETGWVCLKVQGPLDFSLSGVLASLAGTLAHERISLFALSTFDTDYLLVKQETLPQAIAALEKAGHRIAE